MKDLTDDELRTKAANAIDAIDAALTNYWRIVHEAENRPSNIYAKLRATEPLVMEQMDSRELRQWAKQIRPRNDEPKDIWLGMDEVKRKLGL